ncbi:hypothetical protein IIZ77_00675 [Candidatus Saccharibacteria bacterium]|nr:hypothetical protein [Candidatus Saccharibacteria bacterium]
MFEINLVPDVKAEMIRAQKKRNVVFFASAVVSAIAAGLVVILLGVKVGQDVRINAQDSQLKQMSDKIESYDGLSELLTVQKQLSDLQTISENKKMLSRVFTVLYSIVHSTRNGDTVNISSLDVNLETADLDFDGQANAGPQTDGVDFRVLESFKKTIELMKYDYGRYVDKNGNEIPTMCIFEANTNGSPYTDSNGNIYAIWAKGVSGCDPSQMDDESSDDTEVSDSASETVNAMQIQNIDLSNGCSGEGLVCIYRTPQFTDWYRREYINTSGEISGIEHFESRCITYSGVEEGNSVKWSSTNSCDMSPEGIEVINSTNGKATGGELVLMFSAVLHVNPEVFSFANKHMITIMPSGRQNVTDSFVQVGDMFTEKAKAVGTEE